MGKKIVHKVEKKFKKDNDLLFLRRREIGNIEDKGCLMSSDFESDMRTTIKKIATGYPDSAHQQELKRNSDSL